ncbi:serine protease [Roseofilum sp. BLCC_M154]|uniref:Serine protease n=1 Tax=Roseofilum acuticapitatum BLCC-M154 TaxID=3022444 RepID=A0ABT7AWP4_9CYAN|nr:serine protease [Roseofilum acuticapitatum]MDJ1171310.1 serine protease [Roseofilum acuticapitatum BLCC-M154]
MARPILLFGACVGGLLIGLSTHAIYSGNGNEQPQSELPTESTLEPSSSPLVPDGFSPEQLHVLAQSVTVKIISGQNSGSGILIARQNDLYTVVTNHHVLVFGDGQTFPIQTPDGQEHLGQVVHLSQLQGKDLALLQFRTSQTYGIASMGNSTSVAVGDKVFAAGFPIEERGFVFNQGNIALVIDRPFGGGYELGYTNDIQKGMSGGPVFNGQGEVIAINGMHAYPIWGNPYQFDDGSQPSPTLQAQMTELSWAIPIEEFVYLTQSVLFPNFSSGAKSTPSHRESPQSPEPNAIW